MSLFRSIPTLISKVLVPLAITVLLLTSGSIAAEELDSISTTQSLKATIKAIDRATRMVTLKGLKGNSVEAYANERVKGFDGLKVGDEVVATYSESVSVTVRNAGEFSQAKQGEEPTPGEPKSASTTAVQQTITLSIEGIDRPAQTLTVRGPEGSVVSFRVRDPKGLQDLKIGDTVDIRLMQAKLLKVDAVTP
jgi:Cu/Ag efflux protein CusF